MEYDPIKPFTQIRVPVLAITGSKDIQVDPQYLQRLAEVAQTEFKPVVLEDVTHILRSDDGPPSIKTYKRQMTKAIDARVLDEVSRWLKANSATTAGQPRTT